MTGVGGNGGLFTLTLTLSHRGRGDVPGSAPLGPRLRGQRHGLKKTPPCLHGGVLPCLRLPLGGSPGSGFAFKPYGATPGPK